MKDLYRGKISWLDVKKDYGFIESDGLEPVYFRVSTAETGAGATPSQGDFVEFRLSESEEKTTATNIRFASTSVGSA